MTESESALLVSVIIVNYNAEFWMRRCFESLAAQTIFPKIQIIVADNASTDGSDKVAQTLMTGWPHSVFIQNGENLGFGRAVNRAAKTARGRYLFLMNADLWLERDCLEQLVNSAEGNQAAAAGVLVSNYDDDTFQSNGASGFDIFGFCVGPRRKTVPKELFCANGFFFIRRDVFLAIGEEDEAFFLYNEESDLSWRIWIAGHRIVYSPAARVHHRGSASVNPKGGTRVVEIRTSDAKRYYSTRNHLLCLLKNCQNILLLMLIPAICFLFLESLAGAILSRRWSFFRQTFWTALVGCWQLRAHIIAERQRIRSFRKRGDFWMLKFLKLRPSRWDELKRMLKLGLPILDAR
jgi:N-acetylglucosaminyl-diphospho-decaprenol L-rhamnosyltransferase